MDLKRCISASLLDFRKKRPLLAREDGVAIIVVLWVSMLIMWFGLQISAETRLLGDEQVHILRRSQALYLAIGGCYEALGRMGQSLPLTRDESPEFNWQPDGKPRAVTYDTGQALVIVEPEAQKVNVNQASPQQLQEVLVRAGVDEEVAVGLADLIADFIDKDDIARMHGAEKQGYEKLGLGYAPFDGPLTSLDQLLLIPGITPQLLYGYGSVRDPSGSDQSEDVHIPLLPAKDSLFELLSVHGKAKELPKNEMEAELGDRIVTWEKGGIYRIYSCGKSSSGSPMVVICLIVRYAAEAQNGYEVLYRKIF